MERVGRVELRDLQLGRLLDAPCPVYPQLFVTYYLSYYTPYVRVNLIQSSSGGLANGEVEGFFLDHIEYVCPSTLPLLPKATCVTVPPLAKNSAIA